MFFWVKKLAGYVLMPLPFCLLLLTVGAFLCWRRRSSRPGGTLVGAGAGLLLLFSNITVSTWLIRPFENWYPSIPEVTPRDVPAELARCRYVVVLGSGNGYTPGRADLNQLSDSANRRLAEGVRLMRVLPNAKLLLSGPPVRERRSHATVMARAAISLGIDPDRIVLSEQVRDTEDESLAVRAMVGDAPLALVTTGWHMPRSMALFRHAGLEPLACPTDLLTHRDKWHWPDLLWDVPSLERSTAATRECLGYAWIWLRGKA